MTKLIIKNGIIYDPLNDIDGEKKDILIEDGKIVEQFSSENDINEIDAANKTVIPAALDIHSHYASQQVNWARLLGTSNKEFNDTWQRLSLETIARDYLANGYTFLLEANTYPSLALQTIFNFKYLPVLDKAMLLNTSNLWALESEFERDVFEDTATFLSDLLDVCKGFGIKAYNPFEAETWNFNELRENIEKEGRLYNFSALDVYMNLTKAVEQLRLPHSLHAHIEGYENTRGENNLSIILNSLKSMDFPSRNGSENGREQIFHIAHANAYNIEKGRGELISFLNENTNADIDIAVLGFDPINPLITSDRGLLSSYINSNENALFKNAIETEGDSFVSLRRFNKSNTHDCALWENALALALQVKNKWQIQLSLNFPHYSHVNNIPKIAGWLLNSKVRQDFMNDMNEEFLSNSIFSSNDDVLSFYEYVILTRAAPAKSLGLANIKGGFTPGADGDINILDISVSDLDISKDYSPLENALRGMEYVIKDGRIVKHGDKIMLDTSGKIFWADGTSDRQAKEKLMKKKKEFYQKYYSVFYDSMKIDVDEKLLRKIP
jgi:formylmethanofuran dehydrogenase subunit A